MIYSNLIYYPNKSFTVFFFSLKKKKKAQAQKHIFH